MTRTTRPVILEESQPVKNRNLTRTIWPSQPRQVVVYYNGQREETGGGVGRRCRCYERESVERTIAGGDRILSHTRLSGGRSCPGKCRGNYMCVVTDGYGQKEDKNKEWFSKRFVLWNLVLMRFFCSSWRFRGYWINIFNPPSCFTCSSALPLSSEDRFVPRFCSVGTSPTLL